MMKYYYLLIALALSVLTGSAKPINREQARQRAMLFMQQKNDHQVLTAVTNAKKLAPRKFTQMAATDEPYFVFNKGQNDGYLIVSGDDQTIDVLGYCDQGEFDYDQLPPNMREWLDDYASQIARIQKGAPVVKLPANHPKVDQLMTSKWSQGAPYNNACPFDGGSRSVTGCVATAMAQILYYNREKSVTETTAQIPAFDTWTKKIHVNAVPAGSPIDWDNMKDTYSSATDLQKKAVADLMFYCGAAVKMDYTSSSSGAQSSDAYEAFAKYFGYGSSVRFVTYADVTSDDEWDRIVYTEMAAGRPVYVSGANATVGHAFVADGYENQRYHINWGWGGQSDGLYYLTNLTPGDGQGIGGSDDGYNYYKQIVVGIEPENYMEKAMSIGDATVKSVCLANWDADNDGKLTYAEAAAVTSLGDAFKGMPIKNFKELYYFTSLTTLSDDAFNGCKQLASLRLPKTLKKVGARAFKDCVLLREPNLPTSVDEIGEEAFSGCKLISSFELPNEITSIAKGTFRNCQALTSISLPISVVQLADEAFAGCSKLNSFTVNTFHTEKLSMGSKVFDGIDLSGATLNVMEGCKDFFTSADQWKDFGLVAEMREISGGHFTTIETGKTYLVYHVGTGRYLTKGEAYGTQAVVGTSPMRFIASRAGSSDDVFYFRSPDTGKSGQYLFRTSTDGNVGNGVKAVFVDGSTLSATTAHWKVSQVEDNVYTIQVPPTVASSYAEGQYLGVQTDHASNAAVPTYGAYYDVEYQSHPANCQWQFVAYDEERMANYEAAMVLDNLLSMAKKDKLKCDREQAVYDNLKSTTEQLQAAQSSLRKRLGIIDFADPVIREKCISLYDADTNGEVSLKEAAEVTDMGYLFYFNKDTKLKTFDEFRYFTHADCIYGNTFEGCVNLESIVLPAGLRFIYYRAFLNCRKLTTINIPEYVSTIGESCFLGCTSLREVTVMAPDPSAISLGTDAFKGVPLAECTLYVPFGSKELYAEAPTWKDFGTIVEVRGRTQPRQSNFAVNVSGYLYNVGTRMMMTMGEAWGTQAIVGNTGRVYQLKRSNSMPEGTYYLFDVAKETVVFRTDTDTKVGEGVKTCFGDGKLGEKGTRAYWRVDSIAPSVFTISVPDNDASFVEGEYLGTDLYHKSDAANPTYGLYYDVKGGDKATQWTFMLADDVQAATALDNIAEQLKEMLGLAKERSIDVEVEQAVYDNSGSTYDELHQALLSVREKLHFITFADDSAKKICLNSWDDNSDGELSYEEAAAVTSIGQEFRGATNITSLEELKYFTSLTEIPERAFYGASSLEILYVPEGVKTVGSSAFSACRSLHNVVLLNTTEVIPYAMCGLIAQATLFLPKQLMEAYQADEDWGSRTIVEYTGKPAVTAEATKIYGRTIATVNVLITGAPVMGKPETICDGIKDATLPVGEYTILVTMGTITTPGVALHDGVLTVQPAPLTVTAQSYTRNKGEQNPEFALTYKGFRNRETEDVLTVKPTATCMATSDSPAGEYEITVGGGEAQNYEFVYVPGTLTVVAPDGINRHTASEARYPSTVFDLQGRRVAPTKRGLYITSDRKVIRK